MGSLEVQDQVGTRVWRVGYRPDPWAWVGWEWASEGRFPGRWDDAEGNFRTVYAGSSLLGCLLELLADFRADPLLEDDLDQVAEDPEDAAAFPTVPAGVVDPCLADAPGRRNGQASHLYATTTLDGVRFHSRHGDDLTLWAVFERPGDGPMSPCLADMALHELHVDHPDVNRAMALLGLAWRTPAAPDH